MILVMRAFFLLSLFAFLGTHGRNLPEDVSKISTTTTNHEWTSISGNIQKTDEPPPPSPYVNPPVRPGFLKTISYVTGNPHDEMIMRPKPPSPPPPRVAPSPRRSPVTSIFYVTGNAYDKIIRMRRSIGRTPHSPPPPPYVEPPVHIKTTNTYGCANGSLCKGVDAAI